MGYFSNGTEGMLYESKYCNKCAHGQGLDSSCPVLDLHLLFNYAEANDPDSMLHHLIPYDGSENLPCRMFIEEKL